MSEYGLQLQDYLGNILYPQTQGSLVNSLNNLTVDTNLQNITNDISTINNDIITINSDIATINNNISDLQTLVDTKAKIRFGSYQGTGSCGSGSSNSLVFNFNPKIVIIQDSSQNDFICIGILIYNSKTIYSVLSLGNRNSIELHITWSNNRVSWYAQSGSMSDPEWQMNISNHRYNYVALGI